MSIPLIVNGVVFNYPVTNDTAWGIDATGWAQAVTSGMLQKSGGTFTLTADVNFGMSFGLFSSYLTSQAANPSTSGTIRLASADPGIGFRNNANSANLILTTNGSDQLTFNGSAIAFTGAVNPGLQYQLAYYATSSNVVSPNPNTMAATQVLVSDSHGVPTTTGNGGTTATEVGFVHGVTSSIQTQINATVAVANAALPETGGTMSGIINMGSNKITSLAAPTTLGDALTYGRGFDVGNNKITGLANGTASTDAAAAGQLPSIGGTITNFVIYTPVFTGLGTVASLNMYWRRVGDSIEIRGTWNNGTVTGVLASMTLPNSLVVDNTGKVQTTQGAGNVISSATATTTPRYVLVSPNSNTVNFSAANSGTNGLQAQNGNSIFTTGETVAIQFAVPINGWSI